MTLIVTNSPHAVHHVTPLHSHDHEQGSRCTLQKQENARERERNTHTQAKALSMFGEDLPPTSWLQPQSDQPVSDRRPMLSEQDNFLTERLAPFAKDGIIRGKPSSPLYQCHGTTQIFSSTTTDFRIYRMKDPDFVSTLTCRGHLG